MPQSAKDPGHYPDLVRPVAITRWQGPIEPALSDTAIQALETGKIIYLPQLRFEIEADERKHIYRDWSDGGSKNISYEASVDLLKGVAEQDIDTTVLKRIMARFAVSSATFLGALLPLYRDHLEQARTSFRPFEIRGRAKSDRKDDRRLHVDAFPSRPTGGDRILRFFSNINPDGEPRIWRVGEPFEAFARTMLPRVPRAFPGASWLWAGLGITKERRSRYDHTMLRLHDLVKADEDYQRTKLAAEIEFPAGSTWLTFTDQVLHAGIAGQYVLEQTFHLPVSAQQLPQRSPLRVLERHCGRPLAP